MGHGGRAVPYRTGAGSVDEKRENLRRLNAAAVELFARGHVPVIGVNLVLPMIDVPGEAAYEAMMLPLSLALTERCDACLRLDGESAGADEEAARFRKAGKPIFTTLDEIPPGMTGPG